MDSIAATVHPTGTLTMLYCPTQSIMLTESLLCRYDEILVLKNGQVAEQGMFDELMKKKGYFYSLFTVSQ